MCHKGIFISEIVVFLVRKGSYTTFNIVKIRKIWEKKGKIRKKPGRWLKEEGHQKFWPWNGNFFRKKKNVVQKSWSAKKFSVPSRLGARCQPLSSLVSFHLDLFSAWINFLKSTLSKASSQSTQYPWMTCLYPAVEFSRQHLKASAVSLVHLYLRNNIGLLMRTV